MQNISNMNFTRILTSSDNQKIATLKNDAKKETPTNTQNSIRSVKLKGYVGFDRIANQCVNKSIKNGFAFNILCIGETGVGKSTLMNTLFNTNFNLEPSSHHEKIVKLKTNSFELFEDNIKLKLTIIESCGFGDQINKENSHEPILNYVNTQYETYVQQELGLKRNFQNINDTRVHVCLYFICPTGHSLKSIDLKTMKALDRKLNIIPIIAKADTISKNELNEFKKRIMQDLNNNHVNIYQFPINELDLNISNLNATTNALFPLAVIGSSELVKIGNKITKGRQYEWGTVSVENEAHCDFVKLREMLLSTNMINLIDITHTKHYQLFRANRLREIGFKDDDEEDLLDSKSSNTSINRYSSSKSIMDVYNIKRAEMYEDIQRREQEIKEEFVQKVKEKESELRECEKELNTKFNKFKKEQADRTELIEQKKLEFEKEMKDFSDRKFSLEKSKLSTIGSNATKFKKR